MRKCLQHLLVLLFAFTFLAQSLTVQAESSAPIILRISNWEEYIDEGGWDEDELIDLESGTIFGENSMIDDFEAWYQETYGVAVKVEYSTFGTNEDLYNMLSLGDTFDLVAPSEYMFMKLIFEDRLVPLSDEFFDESQEENYYVRGLSPFIRDIFKSHEIHDESWDKYAAGYMWGVTGFVYNPEAVTSEEAATWDLIKNPKFYRQITVKDNVRDSYFAAVGALNRELLLSENFLARDDYAESLEELMNNVSDEQIAQVQDYLQDVKDNVYSFETDSGKADMITGKVVANYQWSGDAIYSMDEAEYDDIFLNFSVPEESTNIYFDAWVMLKDGIAEDPAKQHAAEAFINFVSRPDNVVRNMYYIGYTSVIAGGEQPEVLEYLKWNYENDEGAVLYDVNYFFNEEGMDSEEYQLLTDEEQLYRQLSAQYPTEEVMKRASIMRYFDKERNAAINEMWVNIRCYNLLDMPVWAWGLSALSILGLVYLIIRKLMKPKMS